MKTKTSKQPKKSKSTVQLKDLKPHKDPRGERNKDASYSGSHAIYQDITIPPDVGSTPFAPGQINNDTRTRRKRDHQTAKTGQTHHPTEGHQAKERRQGRRHSDPRQSIIYIGTGDQLTVI
jgi:hypothetical protein